MLTIHLEKVELGKESKQKNQPQPKHTKECLEIKKNKNMKYLKLFENFKSTIDDVVTI